MNTFEVSEEQKKELKEIFDLYDQNKDGKVSVPELVLVFENMGQEPNDSELRDLLKKIEKDENSEITLDDFFEIMRIRMCPEDVDAQIRRAFLEFDKNRDGYINVEELKAIMKSIGESLNDEDLLNMINYGSSKKDGQIDIDDFFRIIKNK